MGYSEQFIKQFLGGILRMKRKYFFVVLFLVLAISLSGCGVLTEETKIENVIDGYFLAVNNQEWEKAKSYCKYESKVYYETCDFEEYIDDLYSYFSFVDISFNVDIFDINIIGDFASAYIDGSITIIKDDQFIIGDASGYFYLQKVSNNWKIYNW